MRSHRYVICDVFTDRPLTGNQLAVFTDAQGMTANLMQALAREMRFSESVFLTRAEQGAHAKMRIFTPRREIPFAGHPTLGTAFVLAGSMEADTVRLETGVGIIPVRIEREGARVRFAWMNQPYPQVQPFDRTEELLNALGVQNSELPIEVYDNGVKHVFVALESRHAVAGLKPDLNALESLFEGGVNVFCGAGTEYKTRMFAPSHGVAEDAATGSAAGPLVVHLARHARITGNECIRIEQGEELGRPSELFARLQGEPAKPTGVEVGGSALIVARGEFRFVPG